MSDTLLTKYLKLKGLTLSQIAEPIGYGLSSVCKVIKRSTYATKKFGLQQRRNPIIEERVATLLNMPHDHVWGPNSDVYLADAIKNELWRQFISTTPSLEQGKD